MEDGDIFTPVPRRARQVFGPVIMTSVIGKSVLELVVNQYSLLNVVLMRITHVAPSNLASSSRKALSTPLYVLSEATTPTSGPVVHDTCTGLW